jgi:hypothetical protein
LAGIEHIRIAHNDLALLRSLNRLNKQRPEKISNEDLSYYDLPNVTLANLARKNMIFGFHGSKVPVLMDSSHDTPEVDELLFSLNTPEIYMHAKTCASYMLFCDNSNLLAASHIASRHLVDDRPSHMMNMLMFGYSNLKRLAPDDTISAYISGMYVPMDTSFDYFRDTLISSIRMKVIFSAIELMKRDVDIRIIDIGDRYSKQVFSPMTGSYSLQLSGERHTR